MNLSLKQKQNELNEILNKYYQMKKQCKLPIKIKLYFQILQNTLKKYNVVKKKNQRNKIHNKVLIKAFTKLSNKQKAQYLFELISQIGKTKIQNSCIETTIVENIQTSCEIRNQIIGIYYWSQVSFKFSKTNRFLYLYNNKKKLQLDLNLYIIRQSKHYKSTLVLENIYDKMEINYQSIYLCFATNIFYSIYVQLKSLSILSLSQYLKSSLITQEQQNYQNQTNQNQINFKKENIFLNSSNITNYLIYKKQIINKIQTNKFDFKIIQNQLLLQKKYVKIYRSNNTKNTFKLEIQLQISKQQLKQQFLKLIKNKNYKYIMQYKILEQFAKKYQVIYQRILLNNQISEIINIYQENIQNNNNQIISFTQGINSLYQNIIQFIVVQIIPIDNHYCKLIVIQQIDSKVQMKNNQMFALMIQYYQMFQRDNNNDNNINENINLNDEQFCTINLYHDHQFVLNQDNNDYQDNQYVNSINNSTDLNLNSSENFGINTMEVKSAAQTHSSQSIQSYLNKKHKTQPLFAQISKKTLNTNIFSGQWIRFKSGGLVCCNQAIITEQKKVFKHILANLSSSFLNFIKGNNVLNFSLPITIFCKQSHLVSIARTFCYAPLLLEKIAPKGSSPIQRLKYATLLCVSIDALSINPGKPFNPIIGETLQGWIDGCPIYAEQISHHPPISAYYFKGRGYTIHGCVQPKISIGMNNIKGYTSRPSFITFDDGTVLIMKLGTMVVKGMLYGERLFNFQDQIFVYDTGNNYFSQLLYGPKKSTTIYGSSPQPHDFCSGKIYQIKQSFLKKFDMKNMNVFPSQEEKLKQFSSFQGIWNDFISFDGVKYLDFSNQFPCNLTFQNYPIPSNCQFRSDMLKLIEGNIELAQKQKEKLEERQRRDSQLRTMHAKQKK